MPPKMKKGPKGPPEKEYVLLTLDDIKAREQKYSNRLSDLRICLKFIDDAILQVCELDEVQLTADKWQDFITCNPLPKPYIPPDVRLFFEKLKDIQGKSIEGNIDWILAIDERSILTQNIFREDKTRARLMDKMKPDFGYEYNKHINDSLNVIRRIEYFLENDVEVAKCSNSILADIQELKRSVQDHISDFFDRYTYRILCSEEAYMISVDAISSEYCFSADNFQMHIWALKNVPIRFSHLDEPRIVADFHEINVRLHIPSTMLRQNLSIRAIRMKFDHVSEKAKSYFQQITVPVDNLNAGIQDLHECLINEWFMQMELQSRLRNEMVQKRLDYEERMRLFEEQEAKKGKKQRGADDEESKVKKPKLVRPSKEPPTIGPDVFPDIYPDFLEEEQKQYEYFINTVYNPDSLDLDHDEINLKRFSILGGVYQLQYVEKPKHYDFDFDRFNMTWQHNDAMLKVHHDIYIPPTPRYLSRRTTRLMSRMSLKRMTKLNTASEPPKVSTDPECPWFVLTFTLPEYLCYWGEPIACHYETITKVIEEPMAEPPPIVEVSKKFKGAKKVESNVSVTTSQPTVPASENDIKQSIDSEFYPFLTPNAGETKTSILKLRRLSASPRLTHGNFFRSSLSARISHGDMGRQARDSDGTLNINDFILTLLLNKVQIRHMERHCLPRIISSFKFPKEVREEELEAYRNRPKGKGGTLLRKQVNVGDEVGDKSSPNRAFVYNDQQTNPERLFTVYEREEPIRIIHQLVEQETTGQIPMEPETFLELIRVLNHIKEKYQLRLRRTLDLKPFKSKVKLENKRLKQLAKKLDRKPLLGSIIAEKNLAQGNVARRTVLKAKPEDIKDLKLKDDDEHNTAKAESKVEIVEPSKPELVTHKPNPESQYREEIVQKEPERVTYTHWTTKHILLSDYDKKKRTMVIQTDRLDYIGFAFKRYEHFPFKYWSLEPSQTDPDNEVVFTLDTQYVRCVLYCTPNGIRGHVTEQSKTFVRNPKMYLIIEKPMKDYKEFKKIFKDNYLNIFADHDACYYIENGYFSEKHLATEMHTYCCMAVHSTQMKFNLSQWNRLAKRRDIILKFLQFKDIPENLVEVRVTPEEAFFVEITELCSDDLEIIKLHYAPTWRNIGTYTDLHHLINSMYPAATDMRCKNPKLISCIRDLLNEIRPLSFS